MAGAFQHFRQVDVLGLPHQRAPLGGEAALEKGLVLQLFPGQVFQGIFRFRMAHQAGQPLIKTMGQFFLGDGALDNSFQFGAHDGFL